MRDLTVSVPDHFLSFYFLKFNLQKTIDWSPPYVSDEPEAPQISMPDNIYNNTETVITCSGNVGRLEDGSAAATLGFEIQVQVNYFVMQGRLSCMKNQRRRKCHTQRDACRAISKLCEVKR